MPTPINISASRSAGILGISQWSTPVTEWLNIMEAMEPGFCEKNGYKWEPPVKDEDKSAVFRWGHAFEDSVIKLSEDAQGRKINDRESLCEYQGLQKGENYITCHVDGIYEYISGEFSPKIHEGKTTFARAFYKKWGEPGTAHIPAEYQSQCQHILMCTGADEIVVSVLVFPKLRTSGKRLDGKFCTRMSIRSTMNQLG